MAENLVTYCQSVFNSLILLAISTILIVPQIVEFFFLRRAFNLVVNLLRQVKTWVEIAALGIVLDPSLRAFAK